MRHLGKIATAAIAMAVAAPSAEYPEDELPRIAIGEC